MKSVLVAADSPSAARLGLSVAADLYWGCGARVSLAYAPARDAEADRTGLDAIGLLSDTLFLPPGRSRCLGTFRTDYDTGPPQAKPPAPPLRHKGLRAVSGVECGGRGLGDVIEQSPVPIDDYWTVSVGDRMAQICAYAERSGASLALVAGGEALREGLLSGASIPLWLLKEADEKRRWFPLRRVLCTARAGRVAALSQGLAEQMRAEVAWAPLPALLRGGPEADIAVVGRGLTFHLLRLLSAAGRRPVIVV